MLHTNAPHLAEHFSKSAGLVTKIERHLPIRRSIRRDRAGARVPEEANALSQETYRSTALRRRLPPRSIGAAVAEENCRPDFTAGKAEDKLLNNLKVGHRFAPVGGDKHVAAPRLVSLVSQLGR